MLRQPVTKQEGRLGDAQHCESYKCGIGVAALVRLHALGALAGKLKFGSLVSSPIARYGERATARLGQGLRDFLYGRRARPKRRRRLCGAKDGG